MTLFLMQGDRMTMNTENRIILRTEGKASETGYI